LVSQEDHPLADLYAQPGPDSWRRLGDGYVSPTRRARAARWLIGLVLAVDVLVLVFLGMQRSLLDRGPFGFTQGEWDASNSRIGAAALVYLLVLAAAGIFFLRWLHLSYRNLRELRTEDMRFTPGWAVGYWFIPILNLWRPKQILDDLWRATDERADESPEMWRSLPSSTLVRAWWVLLLASTVVGLYARSFARTETITEAKHHNLALLVSQLLVFATAPCLFALVGVLTSRQDARAAARGTVT
jgi:Domain of unknown function (DUF4328)